VGLGEGSVTSKKPPVAQATEHERYLITDIELLCRSMFRVSRRRGGPILNSAISVIEIAHGTFPARVTPDRKLGEATDFVQHSGKSVNPDRQKGPHAHCVTFDPANQLVFVCDLGLDKIMTYRFDAQRGKLTPGSDFHRSKARSGSTPYSVSFRRPFCLCPNELDSTVTAYAHDAKAGGLTPLET
jgi:Lactonase, 7-bladed beta-propeller